MSILAEQKNSKYQTIGARGGTWGSSLSNNITEDATGTNTARHTPRLAMRFGGRMSPNQFSDHFTPSTSGLGERRAFNMHSDSNQ